MSKNIPRNLASKQPLHYILVDVCPPMDMTSIRNLSDSLQNIAALACSLKGTPRLPALGLIAMGTYPECLFPLQHLKSCFPKFYAALTSLQSVVSDISQCGYSQYAVNSLIESLQIAVSQWKKFEQGMLPSETWVQFEITVVSRTPLPQLVKKVEDALALVDIANIKKILVVSMFNVFQLGADAVGEDEDTAITDTDLGNSMTALVDKLEIGNDRFQLDSLFKSWFHNSDTDQEHLHLILPSPDGNGSDFVLKCDMFERIINPEALPFVNQFQLRTDPMITAQVVSCPLQTINQLKIVSLVKVSGICDSIIFGMPVVLQPTTCWKIDWEELETNKQLFQSFSGMLYQKDIAAIAKLLPPQSCTSSHETVIQGHFAILASDANSLLVKAIAVNEILLPNVDSREDQEIISDEISAQVEASLSHIRIEETYNPTQFESGLLNALVATSVKPKGSKANKTLELTTSNYRRSGPAAKGTTGKRQRSGSQGLISSNKRPGFPRRL